MVVRDEKASRRTLDTVDHLSAAQPPAHHTARLFSLGKMPACVHANNYLYHGRSTLPTYPAQPCILTDACKCDMHMSSRQTSPCAKGGKGQCPA